MFQNVYPAALNQQCCSIGGGGNTYNITYETYLIDFNEKTQYNNVAFTPTTENVIALSQTDFTSTIPATISAYNENSSTNWSTYYGEGDLLSTFPGMQICVVTTTSGDSAGVEISISIDQTVISGDPNGYTRDYLDKIGFYYNGDCQLTMYNDRLSRSYFQLFNKLTGWATASDVEPIYNSQKDLTDYTRFTFRTSGSTPDFALDMVSITVATRNDPV